jgi:hypothetical protein
MLTALLLSVSLAGPVSPPDQAVLEQYHGLAAAAGRSADAHVSLALWCEQNCLDVERIEHLTKALLADPAHALARALLGQAKDGDRWLKTDALAEQIASDAARAQSLAQYNARRNRARMTARDQMLLALWCDRNGLVPEAIAHYTAVTRLDPNHAEAWGKLGCRKVGGRWLNEEQASALEREQAEQRVANRAWSARLARIKRKLETRAQREEAITDLDAIHDPRAVPAIWYHLVLIGNEDTHRLAVSVLGRLDSQPAAQSLALVAALSPSAEVRRTAAESVLWRDRREYLDLWINLIRKPLTYQVKPVGGPGSPGMLYVEGEQYDLRRVYEFPRLPENLADFLTINNNVRAQRELIRQTLQAERTLRHSNLDVAAGLSAALQLPQAGPAFVGIAAGVIRDQDQFALLLSQQLIAWNRAALAEAVTAPQRRLERDLAELEAINAANHQQTERILPFLECASGENYGHDPEAWQLWWTNELGYSFQSPPRPVFNEVIPARQPALSIVPIDAGTSCFAAGTPIHTLAGPRAIESIKIGDQVLSQDPQSGALSYQPVVAAFHNPPDQTLRVTFATETIEATGIHRFWKAGTGWAMTRDLKVGDPIRTTAGIARITSIKTGQTQPVFNLEVASGRSFFVGNIAALVHDYTLIETIDRPFDALAQLVQTP